MRLLIATYYYPPWSLPAANRWAAMTTHLRELGHEVTIVTSAAPVRQRPGGEVSSGELGEVVRTADLNSNSALRRLLRRPAASGEPSALGVADVASTSGLLTRVIVPDAYLVSWNPWARHAVTRLLEDQRIDCVITSGPPFSTHLLGLGARRRRARWIAEFRDGWLFERLTPPFPTAPQRGLERRLEQLTVSRADAVVGVTAPIVDDFATRLGVAAHLIPNGWDPESSPSRSDGAGLLDPAKFSFVHTGTISGPWGRDPGALLEALKRLITANPALAHRIEVLFVGLATATDLRRLGDPALRGVVRHAGVVDRASSFALQRAADALLLITSPNVGEATGKLFEYLGSGRPIIALANGNEAARIVRETGTGMAVAPDDVSGIAITLQRAIDGELQTRYVPRGLDRYSYPGPARLMAALAERVCQEDLRATA